MSLLTNPFFAVGAGLLQSSGPSLQPVNPWGGVTQGLLAANQARAYEQDMEANKMRLAMLQAQQERLGRQDAYLADQGPFAQAFPDAWAQSQMREPETPSVWVNTPDGPMYVTPTQAAALSQNGATPYKEESMPSGLKEYQFAVEQGYQGSFEDWKTSVARAGASNINVGGSFKVPNGYMMADPMDPSKGVVPIPGGPAEKLTEAQSTSAGYLDRMQAAEGTLQELERANFDAGNLRDYFAPNFLKSDEGQMYRQAQEDWVRAKLRKESGAVIGDEEMEREIKVYFPQPGDSAEVRKQKAAARKQAMKSLAISADAKMTPDGTEVETNFAPKSVNWSDL